MSMLDEYQSAESRSSAILEDSFSYQKRTVVLRRDHWHDGTPAQLFRYRVVKRCLDICLVILALPILLPLFGVIAALMMWTSPGPIFFSHRRIRKSGAFFSMWKFRTMCVNSTEVLDDYLKLHPEARAEWYATRKLRVDPRVTALGSFLRRFSLDELPQIWNVLMGTMSLVGPRPIVAAEVEKYGSSFQCYCRVKPGLTGLWQVSGRSELSYDARVALDCTYVQRWSLGRDIVILMKTFAAVVHQDGAF
jgi:lipopolysaccharide/colanic/teichoic acid biosynthesis glycosyltransferase